MARASSPARTPLQSALPPGPHTPHPTAPTAPREPGASRPAATRELPASRHRARLLSPHRRRWSSALTFVNMNEPRGRAAVSHVGHDHLVSVGVESKHTMNA